MLESQGAPSFIMMSCSLLSLMNSIRLNNRFVHVGQGLVDFCGLDFTHRRLFVLGDICISDLTDPLLEGSMRYNSLYSSCRVCPLDCGWLSGTRWGETGNLEHRKQGTELNFRQIELAKFGAIYRISTQRWFCILVSWPSAAHYQLFLRTATTPTHYSIRHFSRTFLLCSDITLRQKSCWLHETSSLGCGRAMTYEGFNPITFWSFLCLGSGGRTSIPFS